MENFQAVNTLDGACGCFSPLATRLVFVVRSLALSFKPHVAFRGEMRTREKLHKEVLESRQRLSQAVQQLQAQRGQLAKQLEELQDRCDAEEREMRKQLAEARREAEELKLTLAAQQVRRGGSYSCLEICSFWPASVPRRREQGLLHVFSLVWETIRACRYAKCRSRQGGDISLRGSPTPAAEPGRLSFTHWSCRFVFPPFLGSFSGRYIRFAFPSRAGGTLVARGAGAPGGVGSRH